MDILSILLKKGFNNNIHLIEFSNILHNSLASLELFILLIDSFNNFGLTSLLIELSIYILLLKLIMLILLLVLKLKKFENFISSFPLT